MWPAGPTPHHLTEVPEHLRPYQRNGLAWLNRLFRLGIGGLLADDMGLGKTHQGLALLQAAAGKQRTSDAGGLPGLGGSELGGKDRRILSGVWTMLSIMVRSVI